MDKKERREKLAQHIKDKKLTARDLCEMEICVSMSQAKRILDQLTIIKKDSKENKNGVE